LIELDRHGLLAEIRRQFLLDWHGIHGAPHWTRVRHHGIRIAKARGADSLIVTLFAFLHDSRREHDGRDRYHGSRAADYAEALNGKYFDLARLRIDKLLVAMRSHSDGEIHPDPTIQTCWDADRLDLGRVGIRPHPKLLSSEAEPLISRAYAWSLR
jgi:uncharacterized protein